MNEQAAALKTKEPNMNLQGVVVEVTTQNPPSGVKSSKTANNLEYRDPERRRTDKPHWRGQP